MPRKKKEVSVEEVSGAEEILEVPDSFESNYSSGEESEFDGLTLVEKQEKAKNASKEYTRAPRKRTKSLEKQQESIMMAVKKLKEMRGEEVEEKTEPEIEAEATPKRKAKAAPKREAEAVEEAAAGADAESKRQ